MSDMDLSCDTKNIPYKWQMNEVMRFLELYKEAECLWNTNIAEYKNKNKREESLELIRNKLAVTGTDVTVQDIRNKIKSIRTTYSEELNKIMRSTRSGVHKEYRPRVFWFKLADSFLRGFTDKRGSIKSKRLSTINTDSELPKRIKIVRSLNNLQTVTTSRTESSHSQLNHIINSISRLEKISSQISEKEDEFDLFGRSIALQIKKLPEHAALELMQKIQGMVTDMRLLYSQNQVHDIISEQQEYDTSHAEVLIETS